ncbi:MAG TPA: hypothetical protein VHZ74_19920 [Bryobacteraceae bacterium]|nr:hypothetical protein [Bryobacteraceae bacterium]
MLTGLKKFAILCHRWTGTAFCLLFTWWFVSGIFMMYVDYPEIKPADRLAHAAPIDTARVQLTPLEAWAKLKTKGEPDEVRLRMFDGRPAYWFRLGKARAYVYADNGQLQVKFPPELNLRTASAWAAQPAASATAVKMRAADQWTVGGLYYNYEPITKYSWPNGEQVYIPSATGEVIQHTTRWSRMLAYAGPVAHWLYFTPLRKNPQLWSRIVIWLSGAATAVALLGLFAGLTFYSPSRRIPFTGTKRLHMILGLFFGFLACTWAFSGMLSMDPFPIKVAGEDPRIPQALEGAPFAFENFTVKSPREALVEVSPLLSAREVEFSQVGVRSFYLVTQDADHSRVVPMTEAPSMEFDRAALLDFVTKASQPTGLTEARFIDEYDAHYLDRNRELPLPVLFLRMKDAQQSTFYIDPRTTRVVGSYSSGRWPERWLYHGFHSINLPVLYKHRPAWDIAVLFLMLGGASLCVTSVVIAWRFIGRSVRL